MADEDLRSAMQKHKLGDYIDALADAGVCRLEDLRLVTEEDLDEVGFGNAQKDAFSKLMEEQQVNLGSTGEEDQPVNRGITGEDSTVPTPSTGHHAKHEFSPASSASSPSTDTVGETPMEKEADELRNLMRKYKIEHFVDDLLDAGVSRLQDLPLLNDDDLEVAGFGDAEKHAFSLMMGDEKVTKPGTGHRTDTQVAPSTPATPTLTGIADETTTTNEASLYFMYFEFLPTRLRDDLHANSIQISELRLRNGSELLNLDNVIVTNPGGSNPSNGGPGNLIDRNTSTKWLDFNRKYVILQFPGTVCADRFSFVTANDADECDPISWKVHVSSDGVSWTLVNEENGYPTPTDRLAETPALPMIPQLEDRLSGEWLYGDHAQFTYTLEACASGYKMKDYRADGTILYAGTLHRMGEWYSGEMFKGAKHVGYIRLQRRGLEIVSNAKRLYTDCWCKDVAATLKAHEELRSVTRRYNLRDRVDRFIEAGVHCIGDLRALEDRDLDEAGLSDAQKRSFSEMMGAIRIKEQMAELQADLPDNFSLDERVSSSGYFMVGSQDAVDNAKLVAAMIQRDTELVELLNESIREDDRMIVAEAYDLWEGGHKTDAVSHMLRSSIAADKLDWQKWMFVSPYLPSSISMAVKDDPEQLRLLLYFASEKQRLLQAALREFSAHGFDMEALETKEQAMDIIITLISPFTNTEVSPTAIFHRAIGQNAQLREHFQTWLLEAVLSEFVLYGFDLEDADTKGQIMSSIIDSISNSVSTEASPHVIFHRTIEHYVQWRQHVHDQAQVTQALEDVAQEHKGAQEDYDSCHSMPSEIRSSEDAMDPIRHRSFFGHGIARCADCSQRCFNRGCPRCEDRLCRSCSRKHRCSDLGYRAISEVERPEAEPDVQPLVDKVPRRRAAMNIRVLNPAGNLVGEFAVKPRATVRELKERLVRQTNVDEWHQRLLYEHRILKDDCHWIDSRVRNNDALTLVLCKVPLEDDTIKKAIVDFCQGRMAKYDVERKYGRISRWDTSNVSNMLGLFQHQSSFNEDLSAWNVGRVTSMHRMFNGARSFNGDLSAWNVGRVTDMHSMFWGAWAFNGDLSAWNVGNVTDMQKIFCLAAVPKRLPALIKSSFLQGPVREIERI